MTKKDLNNWIMYHEIHRLTRLGFSSHRIARYMGLNVRTVRKYLPMSEQDYEHYLLLGGERNKILTPYEVFLKEKLSLFQDTSAAQMHDWLKEHHPDLPEVSSRTVYNFVMFVRQKYNIPIIHLSREYFPVAELPYAEQAQVDFGEYNMRLADGKRKKVKFFVAVLSRSRMKYVWFIDNSFTAQSVVQGHEKAFAFFEGIPNTLVYDQDRTMLVDENIGEIILTTTFKQYIKSRNVKLHFCRQSDPESKGKVENVVGYVKKNFLYNRPYSDIDALNTEALSWLGRTANYLAHNYTKKTPYSEHMIEKKHLKLYVPLIIENKEVKMYHVRKTNVIAYKSNFYTVPMGTYKGTGTKAIVKEKENILEIYNLQQELICKHELSTHKGQTIANTNHRRDTSKGIDEMINEAALHFSNKDLAISYFQQIREKYPRYTRDHMQVILKTLADADYKTLPKADNGVADQTLDFCFKNTLFNAYEFEQVFLVVILEAILPKKKQTEIKLLDVTNLEKANQTPQTSDIEDYEKIINQ